MPADLVSAGEARELLEGATPGPLVARVNRAGVPLVVHASSGVDVPVAVIDTTDGIGTAQLLASAPALARTVIDLWERYTAWTDAAETVARNYAAVVAERDAAIAERDALAEREAATNAWLAEVGHLSLAAAGVELVHLREREARLSRILACERGEWAPEGWEWAGTFWTKNHDRVRVARIERRGYAHTATGNWCDERFTYALEAIEAADAAVREVSGG